MRGRLRYVLEHLLYAVVVVLLVINLVLLLKYSDDAASNQQLAIEVKQLREAVSKKPVVVKGIDGYTPVKGIDYFDGENGKNGENGTNGTNGINGLSAYEIAVKNGFVGTEEEWLASLAAPVPEIRCNTIKNRWEVRYTILGEPTGWKVLGGTEVACIGVLSL